MLKYGPGLPLPSNPKDHLLPDRLLPNNHIEFVDMCFKQYPPDRRTQLQAIVRLTLNSMWWRNELRPPLGSNLDQLVNPKTVTITTYMSQNRSRTSTITVYKCMFCETDHKDKARARQCVQQHMNI